MIKAPYPVRPPVMPLRRQRLSRIAFAQLLLAQEGRCARCSERLKADAIIDEHLTPLDQGGSNDLANRALLCRPCAAKKTAADQSASARGRRIRGETGQKRRRARRRAGLPERPTFATNRDGAWKKKLDGTILPRARRNRLRHSRDSRRPSAKAGAAVCKEKVGEPKQESDAQFAQVEARSTGDR
jgi:5-methylcytosine-specific restriction enzyme A